jgi:activating signal cointegrator complex subunit 3
MNAELSKAVPYAVNQLTLDSPHTKTLLLLQAHFTRCPLPIRDYFTDTKILLDGAIRLIHCMIDIAAEKKILDSTL